MSSAVCRAITNSLLVGNTQTSIWLSAAGILGALAADGADAIDLADEFGLPEDSRCPRELDR